MPRKTTGENISPERVTGLVMEGWYATAPSRPRESCWVRIPLAAVDDDCLGAVRDHPVVLEASRNSDGLMVVCRPWSAVDPSVIAAHEARYPDNPYVRKRRRAV